MFEKAGVHIAEWNIDDDLELLSELNLYMWIKFVNEMKCWLDT